MSSLFVARPAWAVVTFLQGAHDRLLAVAAVVERALEQLAWSFGSLLLLVPVAALAVGLGVLAWRGRHPGAGVSVALAVQVAAATDAWASLLRTLALVGIVALVAAPVAGGLALAIERSRRRRSSPPAGSPRPRRAMLPPRRIAVGRAAADRWQLAAPVALVLVPAAIVAVAVPTGLAWSLAAVAVVAVTSGVLQAPEIGDPWWWMAVLRHVAIASGVVLLTGLMGGPGLGGELARTLPTEEVSTAAELLLALGAVGVALVTISRTLPRPTAATALGPDIAGTDADGTDADGRHAGCTGAQPRGKAITWRN